MRDILLLTIILGSTPICFFNPYFGVLMWSWVAYFNPHRYTWGVAYHFPVAWTVAIPTVAGALFTRQTTRPCHLRETFLMACLWAWFAVTFLHARQVPIFHGHILDAETQLLQVSKILLMTFFTILLVTSRERLKYLLLVASLSLGVRGIAGAIFGFRTEGQSRIYGPADSFLSDNNDFGLALNMMLPLLFFLAREVEQRWLRITLWIAFFCSIISILLTYSRGGLLGLAVVLCAIAVKSRHKFVGATLVAATALVVVSYAPEAWMARMNNFFQGSLDTSAHERLR